MPGRDATRHHHTFGTRDDSWITAPVPGTAATALRAAGAWNGTSPLELDNHDVWYRVRFTGGGAEVLRFEGLATIADVWLNGEHVLRSENMFLPCEVTVWTQRANTLCICFRSLTAWLEGQQGRARWRTRLAVPRTLRFARTTLLGRMPGWCPTVHPVGPWRPVQRVRRAASFTIVHVDVRASMNGQRRQAGAPCRTGRGGAGWITSRRRDRRQLCTTRQSYGPHARRRSRRPERDAMVAAHARRDHISTEPRCASAKWCATLAASAFATLR